MLSLSTVRRYFVLEQHSNTRLLFRSSSSSRGSSSNLHNRYLRKRRKWPLSPYKAKWHETFNQQQANETLKQSASKDSTHLLSSLIDSFSIYNCDPTPNAYRFIIKTLTKTSQFFHQLPSVLNHLQNSENFQTPEYLFVDLINIYGDKGMIEDAIDLFFRIPKFRCNPTVDSLNSLLSVLCKNRETLGIVPQILENSKFMNIRIEESSFRILVRALCRIGRADYAVELLKYMIEDGFTLDGKNCSLILSTICDREDLSAVEVMGVLEEIRTLGFCPKRVDWCNVIRFLVRKGEGMDALDVLNQMKKDRIKPDIVCYTIVLDGIISKGDYAKAEELFDEMLVLGLVPDINTYNVYIRGLCKQNNLDAGMKMLACIEEVGCKPDLITYNTLLGALCQNGELSRAREIVNQMEFKGVKLNAQTYAIMVDGLCSKYELFEVCSLLEEIMGKRFVPQSSTIDEIICELCQKGWISKALELLTEIVGKDVAPGVGAWEALLLGSGLKHDFEEIAFIDLVKPFETGLC
ncbi:hypothetical protein LguiA_016465 [Lonicera macranthoides]